MTNNQKQPNECYRALNNVTYKIGEIVNGAVVYNLQWTLEYLDKLGKHHFPKFKLYSVDKEVIRRMLTYFLGSEQNCVELGLDQHKGLLLYGDVGVGKTTLIQLIPMLQLNKPQIPLVSSIELSNLYDILGPKAYQEINLKKGLILDDIGSEKLGVHYGRPEEAVGGIIMRFDSMKNEIKPIKQIINGHFQSSMRRLLPKSSKMHATTNCDVNQLHDRYGDRVISRMAGLFNTLDFSGDSMDKRFI